MRCFAFANSELSDLDTYPTSLPISSPLYSNCMSWAMTLYLALGWVNSPCISEQDGLLAVAKEITPSNFYLCTVDEHVLRTGMHGLLLPFALAGCVDISVYGSYVKFAARWIYCISIGLKWRCRKMDSTSFLAIQSQHWKCWDYVSVKKNILFNNWLKILEMVDLNIYQ